MLRFVLPPIDFPESVRRYLETLWFRTVCAADKGSDQGDLLRAAVAAVGDQIDARPAAQKRTDVSHPVESFPNVDGTLITDNPVDNLGVSLATTTIIVCASLAAALIG